MQFGIDPRFRRRVVGAFGDAGTAWIGSLPQLVDQCRALWSLERIHPIADPSYAWVARTQSSHGRCVLKISVPGFESESEIAALSAFPEGSACALYEARPEICAILVEELCPGMTLHTVDGFDERVRIAAGLFGRLHGESPASRIPANVPEFTTLARRAFERVRLELPPNPARDEWGGDLLRAVEHARELLEYAGRERTLIHADLHHANMLSSGDEWRIIDPKGVAAPVWLEPARFILNQYDYAPAHERRSQFHAMVIAFAEVLAVRPELVAIGATLDAAVSACWSREEGEDADAMAACVARAREIRHYCDGMR